MTKGGRLALVAVGLFGLAIGLRSVLFPSQEEVIRGRLKEMARLASFTPNEGALAKAYNAQKLSSYCAPDVELAVAVPGYQQTVNGRDEILAVAMRARSAITSLQIELPDVLVTIAPDKQSAVAELTARTKMGNEKDFDVRELKCTFKKINGTWLLSRVEGARTLRE